MKTGRKADKKKIDRRECRKHADPGLRMRRDSGLLCAGQVDYIVRTAVMTIGHKRLLVLYVYSREEAAGGTFRPTFTVFQGRGDFATLARREDGSLAWRKAPFEALGGYWRFQSRCAFHTPKDEERVWHFCGTGSAGGGPAPAVPPEPDLPGKEEGKAAGAGAEGPEAHGGPPGASPGSAGLGAEERHARIFFL